MRGPNSAMTEFLRDKGINAADIRRRALERAEAAEAAIAEAAEAENRVTSPAPAPAPTTRRRRGQPESEAGPSTEQPSLGAAATKKRKNDGWRTKAVSVPGQISFCAECECRFTVTAYSRNGPDGDGLLCNACGARDAGTKKTEKKKRVVAKKGKKEGAKNILDGKIGGPKTLRELCINLVAKYIDDVEALGDIGAMNMDLICQIIARNRRLNNNTIKLFLDPGSTKLNIYDCSKIEANELQSIASIVPTLRHLSLSFCGNINDTVLTYYAHQLHSLNSLHLGGPFLITAECYQNFFQLAGHRLTSLKLTDTARITTSVIESIVDNCPNLAELRLSDLNRFGDGSARLLTGLTKLEVLEISNPGGEVSDAAIADILNSVGSGLKELNLTRCQELTDEVLASIHACCTRLQILTLEDSELFSNQGVAALFTNWNVNSGLSHLNVSRIIELSDEALHAILGHSGTNLEVLNLNSCGKLTDIGLGALGRGLGRLEEIDLGFIGAVNDKVLEDLSNSCKELKIIKVWGVLRCTGCASLRPGLRVVGIQDFFGF